MGQMYEDKYLRKSKEQLVEELIEVKKALKNSEIHEKNKKVTNTERRHNPDIFKEIADYANDAIIFLDNNGFISYWNRSAEKTFGYTYEEIIGKEMHLVLAPEKYHEAYKKNFKKFRRTGEGIAIGKILELSAIRKDGTEFPIELSVSGLKVDGEWTAIGIVRDITKRKDAEALVEKNQQLLEEKVEERTKELKKVNERLSREIKDRKQFENELEKSLSLLRATLESTGDGILVVNNDGKILDINKKFLDMWDIPQSVIESHDDNKALSYVLKMLKDPDEFLNKVKWLYSNPEASSKDFIEFKDGRVFRRYTQPMKLGNQYIGRVWSFRDVTLRKNMEKMLRDSEEKYMTIVERGNDGIIVIQDGTLKFANSKISELTGYPVNELLENSFLDFILDEDKEHVSDNFRKRKLGEDVLNQFEVKLISKEGEIYPVELNISTIDYNGQESILAFIRDIKERKHLENSLIQLNEVLRLINKNLRHDILNDLHIVGGSIEVYMDTKDEKLLKNALKSIERSAELIKRMRELEFLVTSGGHLKPFNLREVIQNVLKNYPLDCHIEGDCTVLADDAIISVLDNLVRNSILNGGADKLRITIDETEGTCEMRISDNGKGIPEEMHEKIFEEGFTTNKVEGSGLGLYIVRKTIERYRGSITAETNDMGGATFVIRMGSASDYSGIRSSLGIPLLKQPSFSNKKDNGKEKENLSQAKGEYGAEQPPEEEFEYELDLRGLKCPQPILKMHSKAIALKKGTILNVLADCPTFERDLKLWAKKTDKTVLDCVKDNKDWKARVKT